MLHPLCEECLRCSCFILIVKFIMEEMHIPYFWGLTSRFSIFTFVYSTFINFKIVGIVIMCSCGMTKLYNVYSVWDYVPAELQTFVSSGGHVLCLRLWRKCSVSALVETKKKKKVDDIPFISLKSECPISFGLDWYKSNELNWTGLMPVRNFKGWILKY